MKSAVGSTLLFYLVIIIVGIVGAILIGSNAYSKAYKAKNNIVTEVDKFYNVNEVECFEDVNCTSSINESLNHLGYGLNDANCEDDKMLKKYNLKKEELVYPKSADYRGYCVYKKNVNDNYYYAIITYSYLKAGFLGTLFKTPVYGETRTYYNTKFSNES